MNIKALHAALASQGFHLTDLQMAEVVREATGAYQCAECGNEFTEVGDRPLLCGECSGARYTCAVCKKTVDGEAEYHDEDGEPICDECIWSRSPAGRRERLIDEADDWYEIRKEEKRRQGSR